MVEANHAWSGRNRRLKRDYERDPYQALAFNQLAAVKTFHVKQFLPLNDFKNRLDKEETHSFS